VACDGLFNNSFMRFNQRAMPIAAILLLLAFSAEAQQKRISISGTGIKPIQVSAEDLAKMPRLAVDVQDAHNGEAQHYDGVRLSELLAKAGVPLGDDLRGRALATYVVARASDGYVVVYSLAELDPAMNGNQIIVADTLNGKPLDAAHGPFRVVVPCDKWPARWIRMVEAFEVVSAVSPSESSPR
jgi:DMSO/TMAO reductase YedYZ molybdopterin-dependent catalytic subunit